MINWKKYIKISLLAGCLSFGAVAMADQDQDGAAKNNQAALNADNSQAKSDGEAEVKKVIDFSYPTDLSVIDHTHGHP